ncbi:peptidase M24, structural domain-containing protein [Phlyctochytrium arcticum]|nr:peptidase M24, structural domain-containing protein [Phlyctochytrium arcticum]
MGAADTTTRLASLRALMRDNQIAAYIVPSEDAHQSEYIAARDGRRAFISGFTGSAGLAVITQDNGAALWTDGRYFLQASQQLDQNWTLMKAGLPETPTKEKWLNQVLPKNSAIGFDPLLITTAAFETLNDVLVKEGHHTLKAIEKNLIDAVWGADQPARPQNKVLVHPESYAGKSSADKIAGVREQIKKKDAHGFIVTGLDEIAWLFNLRGSDIAYNPVFFAWATVTLESVTLYVEDAKLSPEVKKHLGSSVQIADYAQITADLTAYKASAKDDSKKWWIDTRCPIAFTQVLGGKAAVIDGRSPITTAKAIKNEVELEGFRQSHIRDAAALCEYFAWLEKELVQNKATISECAAADKLEELRTKQKDFIGLSFDTISGSGANGAIIHYKPEPETCANITVDKLYLCDSGAQFRDGTTDVTRTIHFGTPTDEEKDAFTRVLKGHIQIDLAVFPQGTTGYLLDVLARMPLWRAGLDFRHGTGHGVGAYLNVHEGPHGIGPRIGYNDVPLEAGMTITNEPGYYKDGAFGIRIENVLLIRKQETKNNFGGRGYLGFEYVTLVPIQTKLVDVNLLLPEEKEWLNTYHQKCWERVSPLVAEGSEGWNWLKRETKAI